MEVKKVLFPELVTDRLVLGEFTPGDAEDVFNIFSSDAVTKYHNLETMTNIDQAKKIVSARASLFNKKTGIRWALRLKDNMDKVIGSIGFFNLNPPNGFAEIGYDLHEGYWRRGIMKEALRQTINFGFGDGFFFYLNRIEALTYLENRASVNLLIGIGFTEEGIRREYGFWKNRYHDLRSFSLLRREWKITN